MPPVEPNVHLFVAPDIPEPFPRLVTPELGLSVELALPPVLPCRPSPMLPLEIVSLTPLPEQLVHQCVTPDLPELFLPCVTLALGLPPELAPDFLVPDFRLLPTPDQGIALPMLLTAPLVLLFVTRGMAELFLPLALLALGPSVVFVLLLVDNLAELFQ